MSGPAAPEPRGPGGRLGAPPPAGPRFARLDVDGWELESAEERHAGSPGTFWIPGAEERARVRPGQGVKLLFRIEVPDGAPGEVAVERMWVYVLEAGAGEYRGRLQNQALERPSLSPGTEVRFGPEHIADIDTPPEGFRPG